MARGGSPGCGLGGGARSVDDGASLLQASLELATVRDSRGEGLRRLGLRRLGEGSLCSLASAGVLAREAHAFFEEVAQSEKLARKLSRTWVEACAGPGVTDAGLVNKLRVVVHDFAVSEEGRKEEEQKLKEADSEVRETEEPKLNCTALVADFETLGLGKSPRILDYGCGPGDMLLSYKACGIGRDNVGIDVQDVRSPETKKQEAFKFLQLQRPYPTSLLETVVSESLNGTFEFVTSDRVFHHIGKEEDIRAIARQLGKALKPCGKLLIVDWDNPGKPDLAPLFDLTHTFWSTLCLPYTKERAEKCVEEVSNEELHKMWEGENTIYLSEKKYQKIIEEEAGVSFQPGESHSSQEQEDGHLDNRTAVKGWYAILHPFMHVYKKTC